MEQFYGAVALLLLTIKIKVYLDVNFVRTNCRAYSCLGGARKGALSQGFLVYLSCIPSKFQVQHRAELHPGRLLLEMRTSAAYL